MVQTYQSPVRIYKYPFELVMAAYEKRFPTCPQIPIFVGSEILSEYRSPDGAEEVVERKCQLNVEAPYLVKKIAGVDFIYFNQKNSLDRRKRTLLIEASNISFSSRVIVNENCFYYVHPDNECWTCFEQSASLDVKSFFGFEASVEKLAVKQYAANLAKGKEVLEFFIDELIKGGVTDVPRFVDSGEVTGEEGKQNTTAVDGGAEPSTTNGAAAEGRSLVDSAIDVSKSSEKSDDDLTEMAAPNVAKRSKAGEDFALPDSNSQTPTLEGAAAGASAAASHHEGNQPRRSSSTHQSPPIAGAHHVTRAMSVAHASNAPPPLSASFEDPDDKLETEYIHRFLGPLTPLEESRLCELKYGLRAAHKGKMPNDAHLLRFLRARDFDVHKARDMLIASLLWRKQHNVDKILNDFVPPASLLKYFPGRWHHSDLEGRPLFVLQLGQMDVKGILRAVGLEAVVKFTLSICEEGLLKAADATKRLGKPISTWTLLVDLEGLSFRHCWRPGVQSLLRIIETVEAHYPETMGLMLIARAPRVFPVLWTLVSPFINENTRKKFMINSNEAVLTELAKYIDKAYLPDFLGGPCPFEVTRPEGGWHVPKSEYQPVDFDVLLRESEEHILTSTYTSALVQRANPHEVYVHVSTAGCVLTWDFDIIKGECEFIVYHSTKAIMKATAHASSPSPLNPVEFVTAAIGASSLLGSSTATNFVIAADPELQLGHDLRIVEHAVAFCEGDSMQGSHYCAQPGTYILQWRTPEHSAAATIHHAQSQHGTSSSSAAHPLQMPHSLSHHQSIGQHSQQQQTSAHKESSADAASTSGGGGGSHKCKVMYYYEVLDSVGFRGSVQSLESCRSSFSSLTAASATTAATGSPQQYQLQHAGGSGSTLKKQPLVDEVIPESSPTC